jgi:23S rRNA (uracil1939-C5)-methyltransferase
VSQRRRSRSKTSTGRPRSRQSQSLAAGIAHKANRARNEAEQVIEEEVSIDRLAAGGDGVGHLADGRVVFARFTVPGDRVRITASETFGRFVKAHSALVIEASPDRVEPECTVFGECGGCAWQHIAYSTQVESKRQILSDAILRIGKFRELPPMQFIPSPKAYGYRGRTRLSSAEGKIGYRRFRDHEIVPTAACPVLVPELEAELAVLASKVSTAHAGVPETREWELAAGSDHRVRTTVLGEHEIAPSLQDARIEIEVGGALIGISPGGFAQGNPLLFEVLYSLVAEALSGGPGEELLELYAGAGFFTVGLARQFKRVVAVESDRTATGDLERNLAGAGLGGVEVRTSRVETVLSNLAKSRDSKPDAVLLDPPRTGLVRGAAKQLATLGAQRIVYLSCDPATLARDLRIICGDLADERPRYQLSRLVGLDLFPQTPHVEALAVLDSLG